jgi:hypothetical protein
MLMDMIIGYGENAETGPSKRRRRFRGTAEALGLQAPDIPADIGKDRFQVAEDHVGSPKAIPHPVKDEIGAPPADQRGDPPPYPNFLISQHDVPD